VLEPPADLPDRTLVASIRTDYGLPIRTLTFLPLGHDANAWVYEAQTDDRSAFFVKVRLAVTNEAALAVPHHLATSGVEGVVAPLVTTDGRLWTNAGRYALIVYPFVSGTTAMDAGMSDAQWVEYGRLLRSVHDAPVAADLGRLLRRDDFTPDGAAGVRRLDRYMRTATAMEAAQQSIADFWRANALVIRRLLATAESLGQELAAAPPELVLCHADIHTNNVLVGDDGRVWFVDWDETMLAPRERDLMFVIGGIHHSFVDARQTGLFGSGYGGVVVDAVALDYYRYSWALSDIASYGEQVFFRPELGAKNFAEAVARFHSLFELGSIVDIALSSQIPG
jgi:spectinomycin phosphotransferase